MVWSFLSRHDVKKFNLHSIENFLGPSTGYFLYDSFPAYVVGPDVKSDFGTGCLLVFITDEMTGQVVDVEIVPEVK